MKQKVDGGSGKGYVRVADDWEERQVILEDLNAMPGKPGITELRKHRLPALAAAWETNPDPNAEQEHPDHRHEGVSTAAPSEAGNTQPDLVTIPCRR